MHNACYETYRRSNGKCPACSEDWGRVGNDTVKPIGEAAAPKDDWPRRTRRTATESEDEQQQQQQSDEDAAADDADADADADADVDAQPATPVPANPPPGSSSQTQQPVRRNRQRAVNAR